MTIEHGHASGQDGVDRLRDSPLSDMDAQNAVEPAFTKPAPAGEQSDSHADTTKSSGNKAPAPTRIASSTRDSQPSVPAFRHSDEDGAVDGNSDAETIVLPGRDSLSPSKVRKIIKHEDKSEAVENGAHAHGRKQLVPKSGINDPKTDRSEKLRIETPGSVSTAASANDSAPKKKMRPQDKPRSKEMSSGLSSVPNSPRARAPRASTAHSDSESEGARTKSSPKDSVKRSKTVDTPLASLKRKANKMDSDDDAETRKIRRQRTSGSGLSASRKEPPSRPPQEPQSARPRSVSPHHKPHRRSLSTQLPSQSSNGISQKKKKRPAPLQSTEIQTTEYFSDESSAVGSPQPRSSKLRSLTTPASTEPTMSPAKLIPHKKHLDAHGQTFLARACAKGEYEVAKQRLRERPEDINVADYAGNTPLQIAALNGYDDIVKLLVEAGCHLECVNNDKDTPLIDAVENGHLEVVRTLIAAGVNPRKANAYGQEPIDRVNEEMDHAVEIRRTLQDAKQKVNERRLTSEDHQLDNLDTVSSQGAESPRRSPGAVSSHAGASGRRAGTVRSTKTSNHLLYVPMNDKTLRAAAGKGDEELVTRILQVRDSCDDPEAMVAAARGGHDIVMQLLLALGNANPDPQPLSSSEFSTPMLAAIGQENLKVVKLLLDQSSFDPTRRFKGDTYFEIARKRRGPNWMEEETILKNAYDAYKRAHKDRSKIRSPNKREEEAVRRREVEERKRKEDEENKRRAAERKRTEDEERQRREEEQRKLREEEQRRLREEEQRRLREEEQRRLREEEQRRLREEEQRRLREEEQRRMCEEEQRKLREEEERRLREEEQRRLLEEEQRRLREEEQRRVREEEERLRREQLEREAVEAARRRKEKEERREREAREMERRRAALEAERAERERVRHFNLPPLMRWLDMCPDPKRSEVAEKFSVMQGVRYDCLRPEATGTPDGREQWLLNTQVALLLGQKDAGLSQYTGWNHVPASMIAKKTIWKMEGDRYALTDPTLYALGKQLPGYYEGQDPDRMSYRVSEKLRRQAWDKFAAMKLFFVKASEVMLIIPTIPHLRSVKLTLAYRELPDSATQGEWVPLQRWKRDPDAQRYLGFAPSNKYYINGELVHEDTAGLSAVSSSPFPERRASRKSVTATTADDTGSNRTHQEQGLGPHDNGQSPAPLNGVHGSPRRSVSFAPRPTMNGAESPVTAPAATMNGHHTYARPISPNSEPGHPGTRVLVDRVNGAVNGDP